MAITDHDTVEKLIKLARRDTIYDQNVDAVIYDFVGGNVDDAYIFGKSDGRINLARDVLTDMGIKWHE